MDFFFAMGHLVGLSPKTLWNPLSPSKNHIFYIVLHGHVKPYKYFYFYVYTFHILHLHLHKCRWILDIYMECK